MVRINWGRFIRFIVIVGLIGYFSVRIAAGYLLDENKTFTAVYEKMDISQECDALVFRDDLVVHTNVTGDIRYNVAEGDRVKKGLKIAEISNIQKDTPHANGEDSPEAVDTVQGLTITPEQIGEQIAIVVEQLLIAREEGDLGLVSDLKDELDLKIERKAMISEMEASSQGFAAAYVGENNLSEGQSISLYSPKAGIVTFSSDGMESLLTTDNLVKLDYEALLNEDIQVASLSADRVKTGQAVYKIVDNSVWILVALVDQKDMHLYENGRSVQIEIDDDKVSGTVTKTFETGQKGAVVVKITEQLEGFHRMRMVEASVTREQYQGLKIPKSAIVTRYETKGVFTLGLDNKAVFRPVRELGGAGEYVVVESGVTVDLLIDGEKVKRRSVNINDEVLVNGEHYNEGDTIL